MVVLTCFAMCGVCMCGFCNVCVCVCVCVGGWVCVGLVMCGYFGNMCNVLTVFCIVCTVIKVQCMFLSNTTKN